MPVRVLLADENLAVQKLVELTLNKEGIEVITTDNGLSALDIAIKRPPDVILADYKMEGLDIVSFIQKTKKREHLSGIPIILLINATETHDPAYLKSMGAEAFFKKPIDTRELINGIRRLTATSASAFDAPQESSNPEASDLSKHFSSSEDESKTISEMLGWSTAEDEVQAPATADEDNEQTVLASPFEDAAESGAHSFSPLEEIPFSGAEAQAPVKPEAEQKQELPMGSPSLEAESNPFSFPFEDDDPFSLSEQGSSEAELSTPSSDEATVLPGTVGDPLESSPFDNEIEGEQDAASLSLSGNGELEAVTPDPASFERPPYRNAASEGTLHPSETGTESDGILDDKIMKAVQASTERILKALLPDLVKAALSKEMISDIVEEVVWEAVTPLAEAEIKKAIKHLQAEAE